MTDTELLAALKFETDKWIHLANEKLRRAFSFPHVSLQLRGCSAGRAWPSLSKIEYNPVLARDNWQSFCIRTVPHEVSHLVANWYFNRDCGHDRHWKYIMEKVFGLESSRCHAYDVSKARTRKRIRYLYKCVCGEIIKIGPRHHKMIQEGVGVRHYTCKSKIEKDMFMTSCDIDRTEVIQ